MRIPFGFDWPPAMSDAQKIKETAAERVEYLRELHRGLLAGKTYEDLDTRLRDELLACDIDTALDSMDVAFVDGGRFGLVLAIGEGLGPSTRQDV
jgi:hypothetical protein